MSQVFEQLAAVTASEGVTHAFGVMGDGNLTYVDRLTHVHGVHYVAAAREDGAVLMADGYARASDRVGLATVTHGPGLTNTATPLVEAVRSRTPLVLVAASTDPAAHEHPQRLDQRAFVAGTGAAWVPVRSVRSAVDDARQAFALAERHRCPVVLDVPVAGLPEHAGTAAATPQAVVRPGAAMEQQLRSAVDALAGARRVVVLAGRGAVRAGARDALVALADRTGALLATTLLAKDWFAGHAFDLGVCGGFASDVALREVAAADCVIAFGASLNRFTTEGGQLLAGSVVVQCDADESAIGRLHRVDVPVVGDASLVARQLLDALPGRGSSTARSGSLADELAARDIAQEFVDASDETGLDLRTLAVQLDRLVPRDRLLVVDGGHAALSEPVRSMRLESPLDLVFTLGFGSIGLGLGAAVGAAVARPGRPVVTAVGDGGLLMSLVELDTAVRERLPVVVVVHNDRAYGYEWHNMRRTGMSTALAEFSRPDFSALAQAWGATGVTVRSPADVEALAPLLAQLDGPLVVDAHLTRQVKTTWFARHEG
jgi:acetolactate synthase-1/2/3 large subunit